MNKYDKYLQQEAEEWREAYDNTEKYEDYSDPILDELATQMFAKYIKKKEK